MFDGLNDWLGGLPFAAERRPESECLGGMIGTFAHVLHVSWLVFWFPDSRGIVPHRSLAPRHLALAADLVERSALPEDRGRARSRERSDGSALERPRSAGLSSRNAQ